MSATSRQHFINNPDEPVLELVYIGISAVVLCFLSFFLGGKLARKKYARESSQILGQKNTSFTMFLALQFANQINPLLGEQVANQILSQSGQPIPQAMGTTNIDSVSGGEPAHMERARSTARASTQAD